MLLSFTILLTLCFYTLQISLSHYYYYIIIALYRHLFLFTHTFIHLFVHNSFLPFCPSLYGEFPSSDGISFRLPSVKVC